MNIRGTAEFEGVDSYSVLLLKGAKISGLEITDLKKEEKVCNECLQIIQQNEQLIAVSKTTLQGRSMELQFPSIIHLSCLEDFTSRLLNSMVKPSTINSSVSDPSLLASNELGEPDDISFP